MAIKRPNSENPDWWDDIRLMGIDRHTFQRTEEKPRIVWRLTEWVVIRPKCRWYYLTPAQKNAIFCAESYVKRLNDDARKTGNL